MENNLLKKSFQTQKNPLKNSNFINTFESQPIIDDKPQKFTIKKQLYRGIKDNDVSKIVRKGDDTVANTQQIDDQFNQAHNYLTQMRKKFDQMKTATNNKKNEIQVYKKELQILKSKQMFLNNSIKQKKQHLQQTKSALNSITNQCDTTIYNKDVYVNISQRHKKDNLIIKKKMLETEADLSNWKIKLKSITNDAGNKTKISQQCQKMLLSMERVVQFQKQNRQTNIHSIYEILNKKQDNYIKKMNRSKQIQQVVIFTMNQKSNQQKQWNKIFLANKLLSAILRNKIQKQLIRNSVIQNAFQKVKINTGIVQCDQFIQKFLSRQQNYGQLLNSISQKQPKLQKIGAYNQKLKKQYRYLRQNQSEENSTKNSINLSSQRNYEKQLQYLQQKRFLIQKASQQFYQFLIKFMKKYQSVTNQASNLKKKQYQNFYDLYPRTNLIQLYKKFQEITIKILSQNSKKDSLVKEILMKNMYDKHQQSDKFYERNTRIKTLADETINDHHQIGAQIFDDLSQYEYIHDIRKNVKKDLKNRKFRIKTKPF